MSLPLAWSLCFGTCLVASCAGPSEAPGADAGPPTLALGTGETDFEGLTDGDTILIVQGPQDGYHFFGSLRATNVNAGDADDLSDPANPTTIFEVFVGSDQVDAMASTYRQGLALGPFGAEMIGRTVILDIEDDLALDGVSVRFVVRLRDGEGQMLEDERSLVARPHPNNQ